MSLLDSLFGIQHVFRGGQEFVRRKAADFLGPGWIVRDNPATGRTELEIDVKELAQAVPAHIPADSIDGEAFAPQSLPLTKLKPIAAPSVLGYGGPSAEGTPHAITVGAGKILAHFMGVLGGYTPGELGLIEDGAGSVDGSNIAPSTIKDAHIATDASINGSKLADESIKASKIDLVDVGLGARRVVNVGSDRALQASDAGAILIPSANVELTIPTEASDLLPNGFTVQILQRFDVNPARLAWAGVSLTGSPDRRTYRPGDRLLLVKVGTNTWIIYADCSESGTYQPAISNTEHYAASTALGWWARTGKIVSVEVHITGSNTAVTTPKHVEISLPLPRILSGNFSGTNQVGGSASWGTSSTASISPAVLRSVSGAERVYINAADTDGSNPRNAQATFTYEL